MLGFAGFFTALAGHIADLYAQGAGPSVPR
jgi:hypothetical protein